MKHKRLVVGFGLVIIVIFLFLAIFGYVKYGPGRYVYLQGTVTLYDVTPTYTDGSIIFKIDNKYVDIGGGENTTRPLHIYGQIQEGDRVKAKLVKVDGQLTVFGCSECYIEKITSQ